MVDTRVMETYKTLKGGICMVNQISSLHMEVQTKPTPVDDIPVDWGCYHIRDLGIVHKVPMDYDIFQDRHINPIQWNVYGVSYGTDNFMVRYGTGSQPYSSILIHFFAGADRTFRIDIATELGIDGYNTSIGDAIVSIPYLCQYMLSDIFILQLKHKVGPDLKKINVDTITDACIALPPIEKQRKLAEILMDVDRAVGLHEQAAITYKRLKRGLQQELLAGNSVDISKVKEDVK